MDNKKKSIFVNEDDFYDEEIIELEVEELEDLEVIYEFPHDKKPGTEEMIKSILGDTTPIRPSVLPELGLDLVDHSEGLDRPTDLADLDTCPRCNTPLVSAIAITGAESPSFKECPSCGTLINTFKPIKYQADLAARSELYVMSAGGFGSGKSRITIEKIIQHLVLIPNARVVVSARTYPAIEATFVKDFFSIMPRRLLRRKNEMKHEWVFTNGSELMLRSFDDPTKLRGINATMWVLLEASNIQKEGFELAQNRIRNTAALLPQLDARGEPMFKYDEKSNSMRPIYAHDARKILIETNPDSGWVKKDFLQDSGEVVYYGSAYREGYRMNTVTDPNKFTLVMATDANPYLPEGFIEEQTRGKSPAYIQQFFYGSFNFSEGLVYPNVGARIVKPHPLPREFNEQGRRVLWYLVGLDYGISDALAIIYAAFSLETKKLYFFDEVYEKGLDIKTAVSMHRNKMRLHKITNDKLMMLPLFDGRSHNKRESNLQTIGSLFNAEGLYFTPSFTYNDARIAKFNGIINEGEIEIYSNLDFYIEEVVNYKYKMNRDGTYSDKPVDKNNHGINAGEFIIMAMPLNLQNFSMNAYVPTGTIHMHDTQQDKKDVDTNIYNPYEGGTNNDHNRNTSTIINSRYRNPVRPRYNRLGNVLEEEQEDTNIFNAYVPNRSKR